MFKILIFFWIFLLLISIFYIINNLMQKKENFNVSEVENDINSRNKIYLQTNVIDIIPGKPGPTGEEGDKGKDGTKGRDGKDGLIGNSGNDGDDAATVKFINPDRTIAGSVSVRNTNTEDVHEINIPIGKKGERGDTRKLNYCYTDTDGRVEDCTNESNPTKDDMYLFIPKGLSGEAGDQGDCSMESPGFPGPQGDMGPSGDKGEKGPRGLDGKRGIDANKLNIGSNVMGVEYKICFSETPDHCIDVPMLKAINQDYQDKIDNKPYEDILSNTNNNYVPVLLRRLNRLKKDLCLAHLTGDYSNGYITDIKNDLYETYTAFNESEGNKFKTELHNDDDKLKEYCAKLFNIVSADFIFNKEDKDDCTDVVLHNFIKTNLEQQGKWEDRFNTYKNTPIVDIKFEGSTGIVSSSTETAALIIDVDEIFKIFPNIYEIILNVERFITGKHGRSGAETDLDWDDKAANGLNGGKGQPGNDGGPAIEIIYKGTNNLKEIVIRINEIEGKKIIGGFGSLGGAGGKASKSFTQTIDHKIDKVLIGGGSEDRCEPAIIYNGPSDGVKEDGKLGRYEQAWVRGNGHWEDNKNETYGKYYDMIVFGQYHLASTNNYENVDIIKSNKSNSGDYWEFNIRKEAQINAKGDHGWEDDFNCTTYNSELTYDNIDYNNVDIRKLSQFIYVNNPALQTNTKDIRAMLASLHGEKFTYNKSPLIKPATKEHCPRSGPCYGDNWTGVCCKSCREGGNSMSRPKDRASWYGFTARKCKTINTDAIPGCPSNYSSMLGKCCPDEYMKIDNCTVIIKHNENGIENPADPGGLTIGASADYTAKDKEIWESYKSDQKANDEDETRKYVPITIDFTPTSEGTTNGTRGDRGDDGADGDIISTNIQDTTKVIIILNGNEYTNY